MKDFAARIRIALLTVSTRILFGIPDSLLRRIFGEPPAVAAGLRPDAWAFSRVAEVIEARSAATEPVAMRMETEELAFVVSDPTVFPVVTQDFELGEKPGDLPARLYRPASVNDPGPLLVYFHGGGWVVGSIKSHDLSCRRLAHGTGARVLAVQYRLAPEHPFPAAPDDAFAAWKAITADPDRFGADPARIATGGDSAGGNLAAVLCQDLRREKLAQPLFQLLIYPATNINSRPQSRADFATGYYLTDERMSWYEDRYTSKAGDAEHVRASPLEAGDFSGLAPAYVITAMADPLRDEGEAYARKLMAAGVEVRLDRFPLVHAWFNQTIGRSSRAGHEVLSAQVRKLFGSVGADSPRS